MINLVFFLIFFLGLILQTSAFSMYTSFPPDAALLASVYCGIKYNKLRGYQMGIFLGFLQDVFSFGMMGINLLSKGLAGMFSGFLAESHLIDSNSYSTWGMLLFMATLMNEMVLRIYTAGFFDTQLNPIDMVTGGVVQAAVNLFIGLPFFAILEGLEQRLMDMLGVRRY